MLGGSIGSNALNYKPHESLDEGFNQVPEIFPEEIIGSRLISLNIDPEELDSQIEAFQSLSLGQKALALENLEQSILGEIKESALEGYQSRFAKMTGKNEGVSRFNLHNVGVLGKNIWLGITKQYQIAKIEKARSEELLSGGLDMHKEVLTKLAEGLKAYGPEVELDATGKIKINYLEKPEGLNPEEEKAIADFNAIATTLAQTPDEWRYDTAKDSEKKKFNQAKELYESNKLEALNILKDKEGGEGQAILKMNKIDSQVRLNQFLNSNPDVEAQLLKIKDQSMIKRVLSGVIAERGLYMGAGFASRTFATLGLGLLGSAATFGGIVAGAGAIGYFRASGRAKENIRQKDIMGRRGQKSEDELSKIFAQGAGKKKGEINENNEISTGLGDKIGQIINRIENETDPSKQRELAGRLKTRLEYTKKYLDDGAVDFGSQAEHLGNQYNLMTNIAQAETYLDLVEANDRRREEIEARVERMIYNELDLHDRIIEQKRKKYVVKQAEKGMLMAMGFAAAGRLFSELIYGQADAQEHLDTAQTKITTETAPKVTPENTQTIESPTITPDSVGPNNQEIINYLTNDPTLRGNLDLKTELLNQKITVNVLEKGQSIGSYANVTNDTPVNFVQPDGSVEVHGAGEVYVHPGDRVIQAKDGQIYVIKDSQIESVPTSHEIPQTNIEKTEVINTDKTSSYVAEHVPANDNVIDNTDASSYVAMKKTNSEVTENINQTDKPSYVQNVKNETVAKTESQGGLISRFKSFFGGKKSVEQDLSSSNIPESFSKGDAIDEGLVSQWNTLSEADQEVYSNFAANASLYGTNPELAITKFLGQEPTEIIREPGSSEISVVLNNGHTLTFDTEEGQIIIQVDNSNYEVLDPEQIINARKLIQSNQPVVNNVEDVQVETEIKTESNPVIENSPITSSSETIADPQLWADRPDVKILKFNHDDFTPAKEAQIQELYDQRIAALNEIKKQYTEMKLEYADNPKFNRFQDIVKTFYAVENERVKNIIEGAKEADNFVFPIDEVLKETQNPKKEVQEYLERIASRTLFKKD